MREVIDIIKSFLPAGPPQGPEPLVGQYYERTGSCNRCGKCCKDIFLVHGERTIETIEEFEGLKPHNPEYQHFLPVEETDHGVLFRCAHLRADNLCGIYEDRPLFCRKYPTEKSIIMGGALASGCGFKFTPIHSFRDVLGRLADKSSGLEEKSAS